MIAGNQTQAGVSIEGQEVVAGRPLLARPVVRLALLGVGAVLLVASLALPYWTITLLAPQYPGGLVVDAYAWKLTGDVSEVDGLNHYIGMMALEDAGRLERTLAPFAIPVIALLAVASYWLQGWKRWLAILPVLAFPVVFIADLSAWLYHAGHSLDPSAALSSSIKPFTPRVLGEGHIGQFSTIASFSIGFYVVLVGVALILAATLLGRSHDTPEQ